MAIEDLKADRLFRDSQLVDFYDYDNRWGPDDDCCLALAENATSVLDLGCGTGRLTTALADNGREVVGVDPAKAMLDVAKARPSANSVTWIDPVTWIESDARNIRLGRNFDLILLTGHAFQVFLCKADQAAVLQTISEHLGPTGRFIFDSRNPVVEEWREWNETESLHQFQHATFGAIKPWNTAQHDHVTGNVTYQTNYIVSATGQHFSATSCIRFTPQPELERSLAESGLAVDQWFGDWNGGNFAPNSPEIIPIGHLDN
jgi:SAM-dependent methyltransferase